MQLAAKELSASMQSNCAILPDSRKATISAHSVEYVATIDIRQLHAYLFENEFEAWDS